MTPTDAEIFSVSALADHVRGLLEGEFASVWVAGEVSNFIRAGSGHMYFTLKDAQAQLRLRLLPRVQPPAPVRPAQRARGVRPRPDELLRGQGRLPVHRRGDAAEGPGGRGTGAAAAQGEAARTRGTSTRSRKRPLPAYPRRVALVASATGAAVRDMIELFAQRWPMTEVVVRPSRVQGEGAADEVANAVEMLNWLHANGPPPARRHRARPRRRQRRRPGGVQRGGRRRRHLRVAGAGRVRGRARDRRDRRRPRGRPPGRDAVGRGGGADARPQGADRRAARLPRAAGGGRDRRLRAGPAAARPGRGPAGVPQAAGAGPRPGTAARRPGRPAHPRGVRPPRPGRRRGRRRRRPAGDAEPPERAQARVQLDAHGGRSDTGPKGRRRDARRADRDPPGEPARS